MATLNLLPSPHMPRFLFSNKISKSSLSLLNLSPIYVPFKSFQISENYVPTSFRLYHSSKSARRLMIQSRNQSLEPSSDSNDDASSLSKNLIPNSSNSIESSERSVPSPNSLSENSSQHNEDNDFWKKYTLTEDQITQGSSSSPTSWINTILAFVGMADTAYLTYEKFHGGSVFCPFNGSCNEVLNSAYSSIYGIPLSGIGFIAYAVIPVLSFLSNSEKDLIWKNLSRWILLGLTSVMVSTSAYLLYALNFELQSSCPYCTLSAILSFLLLFSCFKLFDSSERRKILLPQVAIISAFVIFLSFSFSSLVSPNNMSAIAGSNEEYLPYSQPTIYYSSSPFSISLAKHLSSIGARMYGAFWCSHCDEQKQIFGKEAVKYLNYVECFPDGYYSGKQMNPECIAANLKGFPTWVINGEAYPGEQDLKFLAEISGFESKE